MANKDRNKRAARQARAAERERVAAAQAASQPAADKKAKKPLFAKADSDTSNTASASKPKDKKEIQKKKPGRVRTYLHDVRVEMKRVVWPSRSELKSYTMAVIVMLIVSGVVLWAVDTGIVSLILAYTGLRG